MLFADRQTIKTVYLQVVLFYMGHGKESNNSSDTVLCSTTRLSTPLQHTVGYFPQLLRRNAGTQILTDVHSFYQNEQVRLAAKAGLAQGLMMPGIRLLSTTVG